MIFSISQAFAQQQLTVQGIQVIKINIDENGTAHVVQQVQSANSGFVNIETINGTVRNLNVTDLAGNPVNHITTDTAPIRIALPPSNVNMTLIKYDLPNIITLTNGVWKWNYLTPPDTRVSEFHFPPGIDMVWVNDRPVYLGGKGLGQIGNGMRLEYVINEPIVFQNVQWQDRNFTVGIRTLFNVSSYAFDQSAKVYSFNIDKPHAFISVIMPQELLWGPYDVTINGNRTLHTEFHDNGTYVWIGLRPATSGTVQITGTTAIPEFPVFVPLVIAISTVIILQFRNKLNFH